ncbi:MAG TPA: murein L,D-transpeptidase catalytic domain family protein, partial [Bdellovibrio sp.]|nr:murein L,D-transpeptidase catalytic domain family protein [Bdellovibrio sp.]
GVIETRSFSNQVDSWKSSIGFYFAKGTYVSQKNGLSLYLDGIDYSNNNARVRSIVLHGAKYVSDEFIQQNGRLGWSEGCPSVAVDANAYIINLLQSGSIIFSYERDLLAYSKHYPSDQEKMGNEILPPGVNTNPTPGEGGDHLPLPAFFERPEIPYLISPLNF